MAFFAQRDRGALLISATGELQYQDALREARKLNGGRRLSAALRPEPGNPHDSQAVRVCAHGSDVTLGYLPFQAAHQLNAVIVQFGGEPIDALIVGGGGNSYYTIVVNLTPIGATYDAGRGGPARVRRRSRRPASSVKAIDPATTPSWLRGARGIAVLLVLTVFVAAGLFFLRRVWGP